MSKISKNIKKQRNLNGMTQEDLAVKIHVTRQTVSSWETDRTQPDIEILQSLAEIFGIEVEELIYGKRKNTAEEKEKQLFGNMLVTVLSVLGCLLIGVGAVMIFVRFWHDFPDFIKFFTCFIPALLGQSAGVYTYIKKKDSLPWCEGASVLWMLGTGVTSAVIISQVNSYYVDEGAVFFFFSICFFVLMLVFKSLASFAVACFCSIMSFTYSLDSVGYFHGIVDSNVNTWSVMRCVLCLCVEVAFIAAAAYASSRIYKKESNVIRYLFSQWINFAVTVAFVIITVLYLGFDEMFNHAAVVFCLACFIIGQKHDSFTSPYKIFGTLGTAVMLGIFAMVPDSGDFEKTTVFVAVTAISLLPLVFIFIGKTRLQNIYLRAYATLLVLALFNYNIACFISELRHINAGNEQLYELLGVIREGMYTANFLVGVAGFVMLVVYGAKERKLFHLNLGFILSCAAVIAKLYMLDLGLIMTGLMLIVCGAGLLAVNLKISRLREKEAAVSLEEGEVEEQ